MDELPLKLKDQNDVVTHVINILHRLGLLTSHHDSFDSTVVDSVRAFQQSRGLVVSGVVDATTLNALEEARWKLGDRSLY
ncbi:MAG: N-acetylmuramoyl-L-alanine amidase, partial [Actinobacteria bacterium]|nr:N-acetylmuramoyl-L-alanine amidase [Actinomycetota bacterium]